VLLLLGGALLATSPSMKPRSPALPQFALFGVFEGAEGLIEKEITEDRFFYPLNWERIRKTLVHLYQREKVPVVNESLRKLIAKNSVKDPSLVEIRLYHLNGASENEPSKRLIFSSRVR
jgi:hypothetical protein